jgi:aldose 1-epimerase
VGVISLFPQTGRNAAGTLGESVNPWPNRVVDGSYHYNGKDYQLAVNDSVSHTAIHGLLAWRDWQINQQSASEVSLTIFLPPSYGYPFRWFQR